jgi:phage shock protein A
MLGRDIDREIVSLRQRINEALAYEDELAGRVQALQAEAARWDTRADEAVQNGRDEDARYAIQQMQLSNQRLALAESDLREHRLVTQELILRVNELEAAVADARHAQAEQASAEPDEDTAGSVSRAASDVLREMRQKINEMGDLIVAKDEVSTLPLDSEPISDSAQDEAVEDDLARRRDRLSKK